MCNIRRGRGRGDNGEEERAKREGELERGKTAGERGRKRGVRYQYHRDLQSNNVAVTFAIQCLYFMDYMTLTSEIRIPSCCFFITIVCSFSIC